MSEELTDFERAYNRLFRGRPVDTRHMNDCEEVWQAAIKQPPASQPVEVLKCTMRHTPVWKSGVGGLPYQESNFACKTCGYAGNHDMHPGCKKATKSASQATPDPVPLLSNRLRPNVECAQWVIDEVKKLEARIAAAPTKPESKAAPDPRLFIGACITDGRLHATVQRLESNGDVTVVATAEMDAASLHGHDCIAQMKQATPEPVDDAQVRAIGEGLRSAHDHIEMHKLERSHCKDAERIREGLAAFSAYKKRQDFATTPTQQAAQATHEPVPEQITSEMLAAGRKAIHETLGASSAGIARCVYESMRSARPASQQAAREPSVTLASALEAIEHVAMHNGPGRATGAKSLLKAPPTAPAVPEDVQDLIKKAKKLGNGNNPAAYREVLTDIGRAILAAAQAKGA